MKIRPKKKSCNIKDYYIQKYDTFEIGCLTFGMAVLFLIFVVKEFIL